MTSVGATASRLYLKAFGTVEVTDGNGAVILPVLAQPMRCAVLAYLTIESVTGFQSRDRLAAIFWPESDTARSRRSLNQLLYSLRQVLGADIIDKRGEDQLGINRSLVDCDVVNFGEFLHRGELAQALDAYQGDFLDGLFISKAPEFERWVDAKRSELRAQAARAAWQLADNCRSSGDLVEAGQYARRAMAYTPYDEAAIQRLVTFLDAVGQRTTAIQEYKAFEARMKADLEVEPSPETSSVVDSIRERETVHAQFTPPALEIASLNTTATSLSAATAPVQTKTARRARRWLAAGLIGAPAVVVALVFALRSDRGSSPPVVGVDPRNIAVMFFDDLSPDASLGWLARGLTRDLIHDLSALDTLNVISAAGVQPFRNRNVTFDSVAHALRVGTLVDGTVRVNSGQLEVTVQLIDVTAGFQVKSERFQQPWQELFKLQQEILFGINRFLRERIGHASVALRRRSDVGNVEAWRLLQQGEELLEAGIALGRYGSSVRAWESLANADSLFDAASRLAPRWIDPVVMRARVARGQYLSLTLTDPMPGQASGSAGMVQMAKVRIATGLSHVTRALALEPQHPEASTLEGYFLFSRWLVNGQRPSAPDLVEAETRLQAVVRRHPDQPLAWVILSRVHRYRGDTVEADRAAQRAFVADPFLWEGRRAIADLIDQHVERGRFADATQLCEASRRTFLDDRELAECRLMILGWSAHGRNAIGAAWRELSAVEALGFPGLATSWTMRRMYVAAVAARSGLADSAAAIVTRAYASRGVNRADSTRAAQAEAWIHLLANNRKAALHVIDSVVTADAGQRDRIASHPWFASLREDVEFVRIIASAGRRTVPPR